jgi:ATP-dependent RNA helicase DHX57
MGKHKSRGGAGHVYVDKGPTETADGVVLQSFQRLPSTVLSEYCQKQKRERPYYNRVKAADGVKFRQCVLLRDSGTNRDKDLKFCPAQDAETLQQAKEFAATVALLHLTPTLPMERKFPEPYRSTWLKQSTQKNLCHRAWCEKQSLFP